MFKNIFKISNQTKKVLVGIFIIICISLAVAYIYYDSKNKAEDPRIVHTKFMFRQYDQLMKENKFSSALPLLDSIEIILNKVPGYKESYEPGIVYNNRGSAYLSIALYATKDSTERLRLLEIAKTNIDSAIAIYNKWSDKNGTLSKEELSKYIKPFFDENEVTFKGKKYTNILHKRVEDLVLAQKETPRRLSVCFTNLGIVQRHQYKQKEAVESYIKAIKLWKDNYTARNNFNVLMGKPPKDRSIIDQLFPPDKNKFN
jgi:tetratricopeptide (TPR) repeat protein